MRWFFFIILFLVVFYQPAFSEPICSDGRLEMICDKNPEIKKNEGLIIKIKLGFKRLFSVESEVSKNKQIEVDQKLERFKAINLQTCRMWNACMPMNDWKEFTTLFKETLLSGERKTSPARAGGLNNKDIQEFLNKTQLIEKFYDKGIPDKYKKND